MRKRPTAVLTLLLAVLVILTALPAAAGAAAPSAMLAPDAEGSQLIVVTTAHWDTTEGMLQTFVARHGQWQPAQAGFRVSIGAKGSAWGQGLHPAQADGPQKREGDGRSPAGVFSIGTAFGYAEHSDSALPYQPMRSGSYCIDVPTSPLYNRIVDSAQVGADAVQGSTEPMRRDLHKQGDHIYRQGFVIEHNVNAVPGAGSCIFAHLWRAPGATTAGCTAMADDSMQQLLAWLDSKATPRFVLLPLAEYRRLQQRWQLPALSANSSTGNADSGAGR